MTFLLLVLAACTTVTVVTVKEDDTGSVADDTATATQPDDTSLTDTSDTGTMTGTPSDVVEVHICDDGTDESYHHTFAATVSSGDVPAFGMWVVYDPLYAAYIYDQTGSTITDYYSPTLSLDEDGHPVVNCNHLSINDYYGYPSAEYWLTSTE